MSKLFFHRSETTFRSLFRELQQLWEEIGETALEMDKALSEIEQECLQVYRQKVEQVTHRRACLRQTLSDQEQQLASLFAVLGERPQIPHQNEKKPTSLRDRIAAISPELENLKQKKELRIQQFTEVKDQIEKIKAELYGSSMQSGTPEASANKDLSLSRLDEQYVELQALQKEKNERIHKVLDYVNELHELCSVLGIDFATMVDEIHPSLNDSNICLQMKSVSNETLGKLLAAAHSLSSEKIQRLKMLQSLAASLNDLWDLLETPLQEQSRFHHLNYQSSDVSSPGGLSSDTIEEVKAEVQRQAHIEPDSSTAPEKTNALIDSGKMDASQLLANLEEQIVSAEEEAHNRKDILDRVDKWLAACEEQRWLEDYSADEKRFNATKGAHLNLKRAEKARIAVSKIPGLVDALMARTKAWEEEKGSCFLYDGSPLISMLDEYIFDRNEREEQKRRLRDQKKLQDQFLVEQECLYGSKPSPTKTNGAVQAARRPARPTTPSTPMRSMRLGMPDSPRVNGSRHCNFTRNS
ncbi:hypothetical protein KP509_20G076700 [Ceratopteris richardii]|uniref:Uncharacterized protein n=1 Tax=Ceratopteris richardii TaxID=49495 RepID=A0A8T2SKF0_CERRI|nr:hypothetical protein KP509_20G076700 [Ceratopteris richardii]